MYYEVIPTEVFRQDGTVLTYHFDQKLAPGQLVMIPLGPRTIPGIVLKKVPKVSFPTRPISRPLPLPPLPPHILKSIVWLSEYYLAPLPTVANLFLPAGLAARGALQGCVKSSVSGKNFSNCLGTPAGHDRGRGATTPQRRASSTPCPTAVRSIFPDSISLNVAQQNALRALQQAPGHTKLLRGVTGSGKTNIYLKLAANALKQQKSTILLVPEIALTSQLVKIFTETFGERVIVIHSQQTLVERRNTWLTALHASEPIIVIGPRSALFAPLSNLGLILIDESHETAYYQENSPRYSALRLASFMANTLKIPCVQGTATPNIVDYHLAKTHNSLVELSTKAKTTAIDPQITIVDLKDRANFMQNRYFSNPLLASIKNNVQAHHQTLIFHNRRGSAPLTICEDCGWQALCPECYLPMTLHADGYILTCHLCGHEEKVPSSCPNCGCTGIVHKGFGTKLLETELTSLFPRAKIARFDGDNNKNTGLTKLYQSVKNGEIDILIGTQTLARGLDLPHLATVGVVQADSGLSLPDFAAEERTFDLLTQVIGRVGRGHLDRAEVIIQTYQPNHPVIQTAMKADYLTFADYLLHERHAQKLPPYTFLARLTITYKTEKTVLAKIRAAHAALSQNSALIVSPPMPAFHERGARGYTWQLIIKSKSRQTLIENLKPFAKYHLELDPPSLL